MVTGRRILVGSLGTAGSQSTPHHYSLQEPGGLIGPEKATNTVFGLYRLLRAKGETPDLILFPVTAKVREERQQEIAEEREILGLRETQVMVTEVPFQVEDPLDLLKTIGTHVGQRDRVFLDVTQGLRHHAFLFYGLALYLRSLREASIENVYYAQSQGEQYTFVSLKPVLELTAWIHALSVFKEDGFTRPLAHLIQALEGRETRIVQELKQFSFAYEASLPLELGKAASSIRRSLKKALEQQKPPQRSGQWVQQVPLGEELISYIQKTADRYAFPTARLGQLMGEWKSKIPLTEEELGRELQLIQDYEERDQVALALGLSREWMVSYHIWAEEGFGTVTDWLDPRRRQQTEKRVNGWIRVAEQLHGKSLDHDPFLKIYRDIARSRNEFMHQGMGIHAVTKRQPVARRLRSLFQEMRLPSSAGAVLLTGLGFTQGVLFSALKHSQEQLGRCFMRAAVITSHQAEPGMWEAVEAAGWDRDRVVPILLRDPLNGVEEEEEAIQKAREALLPAAEVWVNLTGGTSWMSILLMKIIAELSSPALPSPDASPEQGEPGPSPLIRQFILVDRRPRQMQEENPWAVGELLWVER